MNLFYYLSDFLIFWHFQLCCGNTKMVDENLLNAMKLLHSQFDIENAENIDDWLVGNHSYIHSNAWKFSGDLL